MTQTETRKRRAGGATPGTWGPAFGGRYDVRERIGTGGPAVTYRAFDLHLGREVLLKVVTTAPELDTPSLARFGRDLEAVAGLDHPNVVAILDFGIAPPFTPGVRWNRGPARAFGLPDRSAPYVATELIPGQTLAGALSRRRLPPEPEALAIAFQVACALEAVHARGIVHGDLTPGNVLLDDRGTVRVDGFGLSWLLHPPGSHRVPDGSSDLAAMGALLHLLLTGAAPPTLLVPTSAGQPASGVSSKGSAASRRARQRLSPPVAALLDRVAGPGPSPVPGAPHAFPAGPGPRETPCRTASELRAALAAVLGGASLPPPAPAPAPVLAPASPQRTTAAAPRPLPPPEPVAPPAEVVAPPVETVAPPAEVVAPPVEVVVPSGGPARTSAGWPAALVLAPLPGQQAAWPAMQAVPPRVTAGAPAPAPNRPGSRTHTRIRTRRATYLRLGALVGLAGASLLGTLALATLPAGAPGESPMAHSSPGAPTVGPVTTPSPMPLSSAPPAGALPASAPIPAAAPAPPATAAPEPPVGVVAPGASAPAPPPGDSPPTLAPPPAPVVVAESAAPAPALSAGASTPDQTVRSFYALAGAGQFDGAARLWSARMAGAYPPGENITGRFGRTRALTVLRAETVAYDPGAGRATVAVEVLEVVGTPPSAGATPAPGRSSGAAAAGSSTSPTSAPVDPPLTGAPAPHRRPSRRHS